MQMNREPEIILERIAASLKDENVGNYGPGLFTGKSGIALFLFYYSMYTGENAYSRRGKRLIMDSLKIINHGFDFHTFCDGIAGFSWAVEHFVRKEFMNREETIFLDNLDTYLAYKMMEDIKRREFDFLHASLGVAIYFLSRLPNDNSRVYLQEFVEELAKVSIEFSDGSIHWNTPLNQGGDAICCNLGLAHGMPSIIVFLSKAYSEGISEEKTLHLLNGAIKYVQNQKLNTTGHEISFPAKIIDGAEPQLGRKIGWCYGDMSVGIALYQSGVSIGNQTLVKTSIELMLSTAKIKNSENDAINDARICHGTSGIAQIFSRMFQYTGIPDFEEASKYWIQETLLLSKFEDGPAGFKTWHPDESGIWKSEFSLLDGVAGIGLTLLSANLNASSEWDKCLLLS